jgi:hypothetical protein
LTTRFERNAIPLLEELDGGARRLTRNLADAEDLVQDTIGEMSSSRGKGKLLMTADYQDLQINGVRVETYGTPSAAPRLAGAGWYAVLASS